MNLLKLTNYQETESAYCRNGKEVTNFLLFLERIKIKLPTGQKIYQLRVLINGKKEYMAEIPASEFNGGKYKKYFPDIIWINGERRFNLELFRALSEAADETEDYDIVLERPGLNKVNDEWVFGFSDGALTSSGFTETIYAGCPGYCYAGKKISHMETCEGLSRLVKIMRADMEVFYPLFITNILSIILIRLRSKGINAGLTIWVNGDSGAGKSSLIKAVRFTEIEKGTYESRYISSMEMTSNVLSVLSESSGVPVLFDDITQEKSYGLKETIRKSIDLVIRSIYQGRLTKQKKNDLISQEVNTCAVVSGEYMENSESQNARLAYLNISNFLGDPKKREALSELQDSPELIGSIIGRFIQWYLKKEDEGGILAECSKEFYKLRQERWLYEDMPNGQRLKDSRNALMLAGWLFLRFIEENEFMEPAEIRAFARDAQRSINNAMQKTFGLLGGSEIAVRLAMKDVLHDAIQKGKIREAEYIKQYRTVKQQGYCFHHNEKTGFEDTFLWIPKVNLSLGEECCDSYLPDGPALLIGREKLLKLLRNKMNEYEKTGRITHREVDRATVQSLLKTKLILGRDRTEGGMRGERDYPLLEDYERILTQYDSDDFGEAYEWQSTCKTCDLGYLPVIQCNLDDPVYEEVLRIGHFDYGQTEDFGRLDVCEAEKICKLRKAFFRRKYVMQRGKK